MAVGNGGGIGIKKRNLTFHGGGPMFVVRVRLRREGILDITKLRHVRYSFRILLVMITSMAHFEYPWQEY